MSAGEGSVILTCPACETRYRVAAAEFQDAPGRTVRCANCGHVWFETPALAGASAASAVSGHREPPPGAPRNLPRIEIGPHPSPLPAKRRRGWAVAVRLVAFIVLVLAVVAGGMFFGHRLAAIWPSATRLLAATGQSAPAPAQELVIRNITPARTAQGLTIQGEIANLGTKPCPVPRLRVVLQDATETALRAKTIDPPRASLQPGQSASFAATFANPPDAATGVVVRFASS